MAVDDDRVARMAGRGFSRAADSYARARPGFPVEALAWLEEIGAIRSGAPVVELGAGTGLLTRALLARGLEVVAVEPLAEMRAHLERAAPGARILDGTAEALPLPDAGVASLMAANAFHWFDPERAPGEIRRVLTPGGALVLLWSLRDTEDPLQAGLETLANRLVAASSGYPMPRPRPVLEAGGRFAREDRRRFALVQELAPGDLDELVGSWSVVGAMDAAQREAVLAEVRALPGADGAASLRYSVAVEVYRAL